MFLAFESDQRTDRLCWRHAPQPSHRSRRNLPRAHHLCHARQARGQACARGPCGGLLGRRHRALQRLRPVGSLLSFLLPGRLKLACAFVVAVAVGLEVLQAVTPDRDPRLIDLLQKAAGGTVGVLLAQTILAFLPRPPS